VGRGWPRRIALSLAILCLIAAGSTRAQQPSANSSWADSITAPFKQGVDKIGRAIKPQPTAATSFGPEDDAISLKTKAKAGPDLFVAVAHLFEQSGKLAEAERQYQMALNERPDHLQALLGYARLKDVEGKPNEAMQLYQRAVRAHPRQASVHNNLGMFHARQNRLEESLASLNAAVQLEPNNPLYRNNIAAVLVDRGRPREAMAHLQAVPDAGAAYNNMGDLLQKKRQSQEALRHFSLALKADPSLDAARRWVEHLQRSGLQASTFPKVVVAPAEVPAEAPAAPRRLPPPPDRRELDRDEGPTLPGMAYERPDAPTAPIAPLPGMSYEHSSAPSAPLPPPPSNSALRPLPRVY